MKNHLQLTTLSIVFIIQASYPQTSFYADHQIYNPDDSISVVFANGPGNSTDWIGIYKAGDVPGTVDAILWKYVNNTQTAGAGITHGRIKFPSGLHEEGDYWAGFFESDGYNILKTDTFKIKAGQPFVSLNKYEYDIGEPITASFKNGPNNATDWIGLYKLGDTPGPIPSTLWLYVNGTQGATGGISEGSVTFDPGLVDKGIYFAGFFENDGYTFLDSMGFSVSNLSDTIPPEAPVVNVITGDYLNLVTWADVPGETNETYSIYLSAYPITDVNDDQVELIKSGIDHGAQYFEHVLKSANVDRQRTYYYAITCTDLADNVSTAGVFGPVTNTAKGVTTISITPPTPFVADGDLSEWEEITPFVMQSDLGTANVPANNIVNGDDDLSAEVKVALDNNYLYVMMDITDDAYYHPQSLPSWERDEPDLYIGLYNLVKAHVAYGKGSTADYQIRFDEDRIRLDADTDDSLFLPLGENYIQTLKFPTGYLLEARIPLVDLAVKRQAGQTANDTINWKIGDKVPFTIGINDNDNGASREGMIFYSQQPSEQAYYDVSSWTYTWISDEITGAGTHPLIISSYSLKQNYPNPFNPNTKIQYSIAKPGLVILKVFDIMGNQVAELINRYQTAGNYEVDFPAGKLNLASGVYLYKLQAGDFFNVKKMLLLK
ncbi:MAG TPA: sugar-binding protein [Ignavibacteriaceae bacterium]|nr:sugar-binding protein [Ignavibacteriaceae bacterium]